MLPLKRFRLDCGAFTMATDVFSEIVDNLKRWRDKELMEVSVFDSPPHHYSPPPLQHEFQVATIWHWMDEWMGNQEKCFDGKIKRRPDTHHLY